MTILVVGGGSGGHITPNLAVAHSIKKLAPKTKVIYVSQRGEKLRDVIEKSDDIDEIRTIHAGKFRRFHGLGFMQFLYPKTLYLNIVDFFRVVLGYFEAHVILSKTKPDILFIKGGFVGLPVGLAAALRRIPFITHDSDVLPGLANRIIGRYAQAHAISHKVTADKYYRDNKTVYTGPIVGRQFAAVSSKEQAEMKKQLGLDPMKITVLVTGGGLGARRLNVVSARVLSKHMPNVQVVHIAGHGNVGELQKIYGDSEKPAGLIIQEYSHNMYICSGAADIVITRAGATTLAEFGAQKRACIVVPNDQLTGGHQSLNAAELERHKAALVVAEEPLDTLANRLNSCLQGLLYNSPRRKELARNLSELLYSKADAADHIASLLLKGASR